MLASELVVGERKITRADLDIMKQTTRCVFEVLEKMWMTLDCVLVDMKIEFGIDMETGEHFYC